VVAPAYCLGPVARHDMEERYLRSKKTGRSEGNGSHLLFKVMSQVTYFSN
jgi:hypothetical protein